MNWLDEDLLVTKTVETSYTRTHEWDIEKWVETENGYTVDGGLIPKIWLWEDGSGDEWATWHVCVDYIDYEDSEHNVSGTVTIEISDDGGLSYSTLLSGIAGSGAQNVVSIIAPYHRTEEARVRVSRATPLSTSESSGFFSIAPDLVSPWWSTRPTWSPSG